MMARTVNPEAVASRRKAILDTAHRLVLTKGYEQMSIQDVLDEARLSSGAFHHYFDSRQALLDAFIERMKHELEQPLLSILNDPNLSAIEKLQGFFGTLDRLRAAHKAEVIKLLRVWYSDDNAVVRLRVDEAVVKQRAPLLAAIVRQGLREGSFTTAHPECAGDVILALLQGMANTHARLLLALDQERDVQSCIEAILTSRAAHMDAIERVLGAPPNTFARADAAAVYAWVSALRENGATAGESPEKEVES